MRSLRAAEYVDAAAELSDGDWTFDVVTAQYSAVGPLRVDGRVRSRIVLSREAYPSWSLASETAACLAVAVHGGMPVEVLTRL